MGLYFATFPWYMYPLAYVHGPGLRSLRRFSGVPLLVQQEYYSPPLHISIPVLGLLHWLVDLDREEHVR